MDAVDPTPHLERFDSYEQARREFRWLIPQHVNIANRICRRCSDAVTRIAIGEARAGGVNAFTFGGLAFLSDKFATALSESGVSQGDSVAVVLPPSAALAIAHVGALKAGAAVIPLSTSVDAAFLRYALVDSAARALVVDESISGAFEEAARAIPNLAARFVAADLRPATNAGFQDFWTEVDRASSDFDAIDSDANSPAYIFYIESQGEITGVVHTHRSVIGQLPSFEMFNGVEAEAESVFWTASDWSSPDAVLGALYPVWWYGCSVVSRTSEDDARVQSVTLSEGYGRPETGRIFGSCPRWFATPSGSVGRPAPGRSIEIIDQDGALLPAGSAGHIAVHKSDPGLFAGYHRAADRTARSFIGDWFLTGDIGYKNGDGDFYISPSPRVVGRI